MKKLIFLLLPLFIWTCGESEDSEVETAGTINGFVIDAETGSTLRGVKVSLFPTGITTVTSSDGSFWFHNVEAQEYSITFSVSGYEKYTRSVKVYPSKNTFLDVLLFKLDDPDDPNIPDNPDIPDTPDYSEAEVSVGTLDNIEANLISCERVGSSVVLTYTLTNTYAYGNMNVTLNNVNAFTQKTIIADNLGNQYEKKFVKLSLAGKNFGFGNNIEGTLLPDMPTKCEVTVNNVDADATHMTYYIYTSTALPGSVNYSDNVVLKNVKIHR